MERPRLEVWTYFLCAICTAVARLEVDSSSLLDVISRSPLGDFDI